MCLQDSRTWQRSISACKTSFVFLFFAFALFNPVTNNFQVIICFNIATVITVIKSWPMLLTQYLNRMEMTKITYFYLLKVPK